MIDDGKIRFEYQDVVANPEKVVRFVALNAPLQYFKASYKMVNGELVKKMNEMTIKDCANIDNCIYFAAGRVSDREMVQLIEIFQKALKEKGWKCNHNAGFKYNEKEDSYDNDEQRH